MYAIEDDCYRGQSPIEDVSDRRLVAIEDDCYRGWLLYRMATIEDSCYRRWLI